MAINAWQLVSKTLGASPVIGAAIDGRPPLYVERYFFQARRQQVPALPSMILAVHLGGARVSGGKLSGLAANFIPSFSVLVPAGCPSEWFLEGAVDVAVFYFSDVNCPQVRSLLKLMGEATTYPFTDGLISAAARQVVDELSHGTTANLTFIRKLGSIIADQAERVLAGHAGQHISPDRLQLGRLKAVIDWIDQHLTQELTNAMLAEQAGLSESYFRHIFLQAMGTSPSRYVQLRRLERARELLGSTNMSIANLAAECGFVSQSYLTTCFKAKYGMTPARLRKAVG